MALRVVFADDNYLVREGVSALLSEADDVDLVDGVADPHALLESVAEHAPDAVLTDIRMPPKDALRDEPKTLMVTTRSVRSSARRRWTPDRSTSSPPAAVP